MVIFNYLKKLKQQEIDKNKYKKYKQKIDSEHKPVVLCSFVWRKSYR